MKTEEMDRIADEAPGKMLRMDGYDHCCVGVVQCFQVEFGMFCYSTALVIKELMRQGMSEEEAIDFHDFNQLGAYVGEGTPCFISEMEE